MEIYLTIMMTILILTQIIRISQNAISLKRQRKIVDAQLAELGDIVEEDIANRREVDKLALRYLRIKLGEEYDAG